MHKTSLPTTNPIEGPLHYWEIANEELQQTVASFKAALLLKSPFEGNVEALRNYLNYYLNDPIWDIDVMEEVHNVMEEAREELRNRIKAAQTVSDFRACLRFFFDMGLEPLWAPSKLPQQEH